MTGAASRGRLAQAVGLLATLIALYSAWHSIGHMRHVLAFEHAQNAPLSATQQRRAPVSSFQMDGQIFDFYDSLLSKGDRVYFQVMPSGYTSGEDLAQAVAALGRFYLLPAVQTDDPKKATVVVSYFADPAQLHLRYLTQVRAGLQELFVSRVRAP